MVVFFTILGLVFGFALGLIVAKFLFDGDKVPEIDDTKIRRRGLFNVEMVNKNNKGEFHLNYVLGEIERSATQSHVVVISVTASQSRYNNVSDFKIFHKMRHDTWVKSSEIEWVDDENKFIRNEVLSDLLKDQEN